MSPRSGGCTSLFAVIVLPKTCNVGRDHLIHRKRSPFPYEGKDLTPLKVGVTSPVGRDASKLRRAKRCRTAGLVRVLVFTSAGGAKPIAGRGGLEGFTPPHKLPARTAASDGHTASTRARASAQGSGLR